MKHLMLDLETLGTCYNSVITQVGACYFDPKTEEIGEKFSRNISISDCLKHGMTIDSGALHFWMEQAAKRRPSWLDGTISISKFMEDFEIFAKKAKYVWSHATFDFSMLTYVYDKLNKKLPFHYSSTRDIRTLVYLADCQKDDDAVRENAHDALDDCIYQVKYCSKAIYKLTKKVCSV